MTTQASFDFDASRREIRIFDRAFSDDGFRDFPEVFDRCLAAVEDCDRDQLSILHSLLAHSPRPVTQHHLALSWPRIGMHRREIEARRANGWLSKSEQRRDTTKRKIRSVVRSLRIDYRIPILSDQRGYWLPRQREEIDKYVETLEAQARATAAAWFERYRAAREFTTSRSAMLDLFERQDG